MKINQVNERTVEIYDYDGLLRKVVKTPSEIISIKTAGSVPGYVVICLADGKQAVYTGNGKCLRNDWKYRSTDGIRPTYGGDADAYTHVGENCQVKLVAKPLEDAVKIARGYGFDELAEFIGLSYTASPLRYQAHSLGAVFLGLDHHSAIRETLELLKDRNAQKADRVRAWLAWMGLGGRERISYYVEQYLLDDVVPSYIRCVVAQKRPGWEDIRCLVPWIEGMQKTRRNGTDRFEEAIQRDSVSMFEICRSLGFGKLTRPVLRELLDLDDAGNVAEHILTECPECYKLMPAREMLLHICVACHNEAKAVRLVKCLLKRDPDICRIVDRNGFTPLVYMMFAHRHWTFWCRYDSAPATWRSGLASLLVTNGCDPDHSDRFGISYNDIANMPDAGVYRPASAA